MDTLLWWEKNPFKGKKYSHPLYRGSPWRGVNPFTKNGDYHMNKSIHLNIKIAFPATRNWKIKGLCPCNFIITKPIKEEDNYQ